MATEMETGELPTLSRGALIKNVWPDKLLYGATLLFLTGVLGLIQVTALWTLDITVAGELPWMLTALPPGLVLVLSVTVLVLAHQAVRTHRYEPAVAGGILGLASFALLGLGAILSVIALAFVYAARREGEHEAARAHGVEPGMWPDKALAASVVLLVSGVLTAGWGVALTTRAIQFEGFALPPATFGLIAIGAGLLCMAATVSLYYQRAPWLARTACLASFLSVGLYVVGPVLSLVALVLIHRACREGEFTRGVASQLASGAPSRAASASR